MFGFGKKKGHTLGLDITSSSITVAQVEKTKLGCELTRYASIASPPNTVREGLIADPETVGAVVQECIMQAGVAASGSPPVVNTVVPGQSVVIRLMPVPIGMPPDEEKLAGWKRGRSSPKPRRRVWTHVGRRGLGYRDS